MNVNRGITWSFCIIIKLLLGYLDLIISITTSDRFSPIKVTGRFSESNWFTVPSLEKSLPVKCFGRTINNSLDDSYN
ncbi:hypothetical protein SAMN04488116_2389 [Flagellimonas flava]|uniref:Uncharacterized protein n=1 Tax=Flagellimonas flava TaxID=570519 RepID=A0A1M5MDD1_9FLAO|nr:hypothetical protein SAMN04488116_2389 [Allomuricauda flava]